MHRALGVVPNTTQTGLRGTHLRRWRLEDQFRVILAAVLGQARLHEALFQCPCLKRIEKNYRVISALLFIRQENKVGAGSVA